MRGAKIGNILEYEARHAKISRLIWPEDKAFSGIFKFHYFGNFS